MGLIRLPKWTPNEIFNEVMPLVNILYILKQNLCCWYPFLLTLGILPLTIYLPLKYLDYDSISVSMQAIYSEMTTSFPQ